mmetsp:Transcript_53973/g.150097  ORF Transcript_53973/g.150097 Transcript_53973/m.150097 type:complete len:213 (+) Transcript_53973:92-730(+)
MASASVLVVMAACAGAAWAGEVARCPGEGDRYGDHKCNHDPTHRVCAQLLDSSGQPLSWGPKGDFWEITGQKAFQWDGEIRANHGDSWCICMWATARLITSVGCESVHLHCDATDVPYILKSYEDGGVDLEPAKQCLQQKCPGLMEEVDATVPHVAGSAATGSSGRRELTVVSIALLSLVLVACLAARRTRHVSHLEAALSADRGADSHEVE